MINFTYFVKPKLMMKGKEMDSKIRQKTFIGEVGPLKEDGSLEAVHIGYYLRFEYVKPLCKVALRRSGRLSI